MFFQCIISNIHQYLQQWRRCVSTLRIFRSMFSRVAPPTAPRAKVTKTLWREAKLPPKLHHWSVADPIHMLPGRGTLHPNHTHINTHTVTHTHTPSSGILLIPIGMYRLQWSVFGAADVLLERKLHWWIHVSCLRRRRCITLWICIINCIQLKYSLFSIMYWYFEILKNICNIHLFSLGSFFWLKHANLWVLIMAKTIDDDFYLNSGHKVKKKKKKEM